MSPAQVYEFVDFAGWILVGAVVIIVVAIVSGVVLWRNRSGKRGAL